jgi:phosphate transport system substrate-binding protein
MKLLNTIKTIVVIAAAGMTLLACGRGGQTITVAGSTAFQPFAERLADQYLGVHPGVNITIQGGGSAVGIQSALSGAAQIGMADMVELPGEAKSLEQFTVARDGIVMIVNPKNPVGNLSMKQIQDIYNGTVKNWKDLGGANGVITVISREDGSGTRSSFEALVKNITLYKGALIQDSNGTVRETVANDANAIGYISHGLVSDKIKALTVNGVACTEEAIAGGKYLLVRPIFLLTKGAPVGEVKSFIDYVLSADGQGTIKANGLIPAK